MTLQIEAMPAPLRVDADGVVRVGQTRIPIDRVIFAYTAGESPEQIADDFPTLRLSEVYGVISYYLEHRETVDAYLLQREAEAAEVRREIESRPGYKSWPVWLNELRGRTG